MATTATTTTVEENKIELDCSKRWTANISLFLMERNVIERILYCSLV